MKLEQIAIKSWKKYIERKQKLNSLLKLMEIKTKRKELTKVILSLQMNVEHKLRKKDEFYFIVRLNQINLLRSTFNSLASFTRFRKDLFMKS
jgi:hypothetical protein